VTATKAAASRARIPDSENATVRAGSHVVQLTNLNKVFWPELGLTKRDLLRYYTAVSTALLPHLKDRAMVMKRSGS
jgi:bifunctional non-homologous end joining protein LigD